MNRPHHIFRVVPVLIAAGCRGTQSTLEPAGKEAAQIAELFWWMLGGAIIIWLVMVVLAVYAIWVDPERHDPRRTARFIIGGGVVFPTVVIEKHTRRTVQLRHHNALGTVNDERSVRCH